MRAPKAEWVFVIAGALGVAALSYAAYRMVGFLGIGLLGLMIAFIAVQTDLDKGAAIGGVQNADMYAQQTIARQQMSRSEKSAHRSDMHSFTRPIMLAKIAGAILAAIGFGALLLHGWR